MKIGVYICHCGLNIAAAVDVEQTVEYAKTLPGVAVARNYNYMCSDPGQKLIQDDIEEFGVDWVIVAACSPRMHEPTFRGTISGKGLNPYMLEMANIREQCSWIHTHEPERATQKAKDLIRMAVAKSSLLEPLETEKLDVTHKALVIGGGVAGIQTALDIADSGYKVYLVEKSPSIGGRMAQIDKTFPTLDCSACILTPKMVDVARHPNIELLTYSEILNIDGYVGNFKVKVLKKPRYVDEETCTGCGDCVLACPYISLPHEFNEGLILRGNVYVPFPQAVPLIYTIDRDHCVNCGNCVAICEPGSIDLYQQPEEIEFDVGAIILATGYDLFDPRKKPEFGYGEYDNVLTGMEFERLCNAAGPTGGNIVLKDGTKPRDVAFIQCVGSRDETVGNLYCSRVCCMYTAKHAHLVREKVPDANLTIFYMDVRAFGKGFEEFYDRVRKERVIYRRGNPSEIYRKGDRLVIRAEDTLLGKPIEVEADMVVLATAIVPRYDSSEIQSILRLSRSADQFFLEAHPKLRPIDTTTDGIFLAGCCQGPKDIPDTVAQASGAAARAITIISKDELESEGIIAAVDEEICAGCGICEPVCAYSAITVDVKDDGMRTASVNAAMCKGCGTCVSACPSGAMQQRGFKDVQIMAMIDAAAAGE